MSEQSDITRKFVFQGMDIRGEMVHLDRSYSEINAIHQYAPGVAQLLGEFLAAAVLLSTTIKFQGRLILQSQGNGEIPLLMAECTHELDVRAIARGAEQATALEFASLLGGGHLSITIEPLKGKRYQGIVSLEGANLSSCIESYFTNSEQLATRLWLACDGATATGLLLQQLPAQEVPEPEPRARQWEHICTLAETVTNQELIEVSQENLLLRLFHEDPLIMFDSRRVQFACSCSRERCQRALSSLGEAELRDLLQEQQPIDIECEFCNQHYEFTAIDFELADGAAEPDALH